MRWPWTRDDFGLTKRQERIYARRYAHMGPRLRRCKIGVCLSCWVGSLTGQHRREKRSWVELNRKLLAEVKARRAANPDSHEWLGGDR